MRNSIITKFEIQKKKTSSLGYFCMMMERTMLRMWLAMCLCFLWRMSNVCLCCVEEERQCLLNFRRCIYVDSCNLLADWKGEDPCRWPGVGCSNSTTTTGHVLKLSIGSLLHNLPQYYECLIISSRLDPCLSTLKHLRYLDLSLMQFNTTTPISPFIGSSFTSLQYLDLSRAGFVEPFPFTFSNLTSLKHLDLNWMYLLRPNFTINPTIMSTPIPQSIGSSLTSLKYLDLSHSSFAGAIPPNFGNLTRLKHLGLRGSFSLSSGPEWLSHLSSLQYLDVSGVDLSISSGLEWLSHLSSLQYLDMSGANLSISSGLEWLSHLSSLQYLDMSEVKLWDFKFPETIKSKFRNLTSLKHLDLCYISNLHFDNLEWLSHLSSLQYLDMSEMNLTDVVNWPIFLYKLPALSELHLSGCGLSLFPPNDNSSFFTIANISSLTILDLSGNNFLDANKFDHFLPNLSTSLVHLDLSMCSMRGPIPHSLGSMTSLKILNLRDNSLTGSIPESLNKLLKLEYLLLDSNLLEGLFPVSLANLSNVKFLYLSYNKSVVVSSTIKAQPSLMFCSLQFLDLSNNQLRGSFPYWVGQLSKLEFLDMGNNFLSGSVPGSLGELKNLQTLDLHSNSLNGSVPKSLGQLSELSVLDLSFNSFQGVVSDAHFTRMTELKYLSLSGNHLIFETGSTWVPPFQLETIYLVSNTLGPQFPLWLQTQNYITELDISNTGIVGVIPDWFWDIASSASYLNISKNNIKGELPTSLRSLGADVIDMSSNKFRGNLPYLNSRLMSLFLQNNSFSGDLQSILNREMRILFIVVLSRNNLTGNIPSDLCYLNVRYLDLSHNNISGAIHECQSNSSLTLDVLNLASNHFIGTIPRWICASQTSLNELHLQENQFHGEIPHFLKYCTNLEILDLGVNKLTGSIPSWIGESLSSLKYLRLRSNMLNNAIPPQLSFLSQLQVLDISQNVLSGPIPKTFKNFTAMTKTKRLVAAINYTDPSYQYLGPVSLSDAALSEEMLNVVIKGRQAEYTEILSLLMTLDLSCNNFTGEIPMELTDLVGLQSLNLSQNQLKGHIPDNFASMELESLDLSRNKLSGGIPSSIALLTSLSVLNLSYNNLSGPIPSGPQLQTFINASIYEGNPGLCGPPLTKACSTEQPQSRKGGENGNSDSDMFGLYLGMGLGYVVGLWGVSGVLVFKNSWRIAYFRFFDDMTDRFHAAKEILKRQALSVLLG